MQYLGRASKLNMAGDVLRDAAMLDGGKLKLRSELRQLES